MKNKIQLFENNNIRSIWDEEQEKWWWSIIDIIAILTDSIDPTAYWRKLKQRLIKGHFHYPPLPNPTEKPKQVKRRKA